MADEMWVNMGPQHPFNHGLWNLRVRLDGETITAAEPIVGYLHRGWEKMVENRTYPQIIPLADRLCYGSSFSWSHLYCLAAERLFDIEIPERAKYIRTACLEIQRIISHLTWLMALGTDLGSYTILIWCLREREVFIDRMVDICGARMTYNYPRIGGVRNDLPPNFARDVIRSLDLFETRLQEIEALTDSNAAFRMRTVNIGNISAEKAINLGLTGPNLRGSGVELDLRRHEPYEVYDDMDFEICTATDGDAWSRYRVRVDEMRESDKIIRQCLDKMPEGPVRVKVPRCPPKGTVGCRVEDPRGESLMYIVSDGTDKPYRLKVRSPNYINLSAAPAMLLGYKISDVPSIMGVLDMCIGETDR
ncbi:MAG: NADH-quinone oxidoreductase subunit D [Methanomassiliicoccales archaeon]|nr:NADH-quinone oxidoreductase subunit D [Methanomassiliicoccales archaeon]